MIDGDRPCGSGVQRGFAAVTDRDSARRYLEGTGQCADVPTLAPARAPPQVELDWDVEVDFADEAALDQEVYDY